ncbi:hypothetical protein GGI19_002004 [Coemansia pectinata]|uniref:Uncharacterized protein n=1 Tax=Coemansia pectinata TaxID=1052879 RepID=A0A9W8H2E8_9FUNG|nr:hypothetical protein GGI19_002004 [Coemansia pectinata]
MLRTVLKPKLASAIVARTWTHTSTVSSIHASRRGVSDQHANRQNNIDEEDEIGIDPPVSLYARVATAAFIGGVSYYLYTEHGSAIARHLPWPAKQSSDTYPAGVKGQSSQKSKLRASLAPKSEMSHQEQVNWAWTHPGLYVVGSNEYGLVDPMHPGLGVGLKAAVPGLEGKLLRSAAFAKTHAAAVDIDGNLYQWGTGFSTDSGPHMPQCTLRDSGITAMAASRDYVVLLDRKSRIRLVRGNNSQATELATPTLEFEPRLGWRENVVAVSAGEDHIAATTSSGHVYTCALGPSGNDRGQLGHGPTTTVQPFVLKRIKDERPFSSAVCGGRHTLLLAADGDVWGCGANDFGQLAMGQYSEATRTISELTPLRALWDYGIFRPTVARAQRIAAGAKTSYFEVSRSGAGLDLLAVGCGIDGQLGNGAFTHIQGRPTRVTALSGAGEIDPETGLRRPVGVRSISANGSSDHVVMVCDNHTNVQVDKSARSVTKTPLFGYDVVVWGSNSSGQCIPDRKHRFAEPEHPPPLYISKSSVGQDQSSPRLQAAPRQWVSTSSFQNTESTNNKKYLVEQEFVTGPDVTSAFLKPM